MVETKKKEISDTRCLMGGGDTKIAEQNPDFDPLRNEN
jgi:hypothetical protein